VTISGTMRKLLRVREMEEEQSRAALERALSEQKRLEAALEEAKRRERKGKELLAESAFTGELTDRVAGIEEIRTAERHAGGLKARLGGAEQVVELRRQEMRARRIERLRVETLITRRQEEEAVETERRAQRDLDDWFLQRW